jgi:hypothetical protein
MVGKSLRSTKAPSEPIELDRLRADELLFLGLDDFFFGVPSDFFFFEPLLFALGLDGVS